MPTLRNRPRRPRRGFTLMETVISMTIIISVMAMASRLFLEQVRMLSQQSGRLEAQQNAQFSLATLDREMRVAGIGVVDAQPILVQADSRAITFNADLVSRVLNDPGAVYIDQDADSSSTLVFNKAEKRLLPLSTKQYPDSTYTRNGGVPSNAETVSFWVSRDSTSPAANEYLLFRRINGDPARVVARGIRVNPGDTIFQYYKKDSIGNPVAIPSSQLPLYHNAAVHGATNDTGRFSALSDSIRTVRVRMTAMYRDRNGVQIIRRIDMTIQLMNAGLIRRSSCGEPPISVSPTGSTMLDTLTNIQMAKVEWNKSADEGVGEKDVERYSIFRRLSTSLTFSEPIASIPAGSATYTFYDRDVNEGEVWVYGVTSQDCTPSSSSMGSTLEITIPASPAPPAPPPLP